MSIGNHMELLHSKWNSALFAQDARELRGGFGAALETIKLMIVIKATDWVVNHLAMFVISHGIEPLADLDGIWLLAIGTLGFVSLAYVALWEHMRPRHIGMRLVPLTRSLRELGAGYALGTLIMGASVLAAVALGGFALRSNLEHAVASEVLLIAAIYLFQAFGEEALYRGACLACLARRNGVAVAVAISSLLFSLHHSASEGYGLVAFVNLALLGALASLLTLRTGRLWCATAVHAAWNFVQGNVFGVAVSGVVADQSRTLLVATPHGASLVTGGAMGMEGSLAATVALLAAIAIVFARPPQKPAVS